MKPKIEISEEVFVPYVPSTWHKIDVMLELADTIKGKKMADLGAGDGRIVIQFAKAGAEAHGYEVDPTLAFKAEQNIMEEGLDEKAFIHIEDFFQIDYSQYDIITIYGMSVVLAKLEKPIQRALKPGARVISSIFTFPNWKPRISKDNVHLYVK